ncbi:MAG: PadR family transcriptional regulator [Clostridia bacterium]|nr:PadR family transcriptional regulator [Clostridia bacterium]
MAHSGDLLRGHTETIILRILKDGDSYGYEIAKKIMDAGEGIIDVKDATIYTAFRRMEEEGLLATYWGDGVGGARRRYYSITERGRANYDERLKEWIKVDQILNNLIKGEQND